MAFGAAFFAFGAAFLGAALAFGAAFFAFGAGFAGAAFFEAAGVGARPTMPPRRFMNSACWRCSVRSCSRACRSNARRAPSTRSNALRRSSWLRARLPICPTIPSIWES